MSFEFGFAGTKVSPRPMYLPAPDRDPIWILTGKGVSDLMTVSSLPIAAMPEKGERHLLFVWDGEIRRFLSERLNRYFKYA